MPKRTVKTMTLEVVRANIVNAILQRDCVDPLRRIVGLQRHRSLVPVVLETGEELEHFKEAFRSGVTASRLSPDGTRLLQRQGKKLVVRERKSTVVEVSAPDVVHFGYTAGGLIWVATPSSIDLYDHGLTKIDAVPVTPWTDESSIAVQPAAPEWVLGVGYLGDSFGGAVAFTVKGKKLAVQEDAAAAIRTITLGEYARFVGLLGPKKLLVIDRDQALRVASWPPKSKAQRIECPHEEGELTWNVTASPKRVLIGLDSKATTEAILVFDPKTFAPLGTVVSPTAGTRSKLEFYSGDTFAATSEGPPPLRTPLTTIWRLSP